MMRDGRYITLMLIQLSGFRAGSPIKRLSPLASKRQLVSTYNCVVPPCAFELVSIIVDVSPFTPIQTDS